MEKETHQELTPELLLRAYAAGFFPMAESRSGPISWFSPDPRAIIPLENFKVSRSLRQAVRKARFDIQWDTAFREVMHRCAAREETWISDEIIDAYCRLFSMGFAHSVECWRENRLVGGLYGVAIQGAFFGESMFSEISNASKVALYFLVGRLKKAGFSLLDTQFLTSHLLSLGACEIPREKYILLLENALRVETHFTECHGVL
jgi:leucyl/phenylalanyl-tRNA--protein transferase